MIPAPPAASPRSARSPARRLPSRSLELGAVVLFFLAFLALKGFAVRAYHIDSDEPQHMHVVWGWAHGLVQYRDLFDNHTPLFQMLCAPVFALFPERADIVNVMRWFMFPLCALTLWFTALAARDVAPPGFAKWAALITLALPGFFYTSEEFRTDALWVVFWMLAIVILLQRPFTVRTAFRFGLVLGATFATSMKTTMLLLSLAGGTVALLCTRAGAWPSFASVAQKIAAALAGLVIVPGALIAYFATQHALPQMFYGVIQHNMLHGLGTERSPWVHIVRFSIRMALCIGLARWLYQRSARTEQHRLLLFLFFTGATMFGLLYNIWPVVTPQDYLPFYPLLGILLTVASSWLAPSFRLPMQVVGLTAALAFIVHAHPPLGDETAAPNAVRAAALRLVHPGETIMDAKGEMIYRQRSIYYVLELLTLKRLAAGIIPDNIPAQLVATHTCVVHFARLHGEDALFVQQHYLPIQGRLLALGEYVAAPEADVARSFDTIIPARYAVVRRGSEPFTGSVDGQPYLGPVELAAGHHTLTPSNPSPQLAVIWARAAEQGFSPSWKKEFHEAAGEEEEKP